MADDMDSRWGQAVAPIAQVDEGERLFMLRVFNWMALGVAFTGSSRALCRQFARRSGLCLQLLLCWLFGDSRPRTLCPTNHRHP